jgi:hypothetical protein
MAYRSSGGLAAAREERGIRISAVMNSSVVGWMPFAGIQQPASSSAFGTEKKAAAPSVQKKKSRH